MVRADDHRHGITGSSADCYWRRARGGRRRSSCRGGSSCPIAESLVEGIRRIHARKVALDSCKVRICGHGLVFVGNGRGGSRIEVSEASTTSEISTPSCFRGCLEGWRVEYRVVSEQLMLENVREGEHYTLTRHLDLAGGPIHPNSLGSRTHFAHQSQSVPRARSWKSRTGSHRLERGCQYIHVQP